MSTQKELDPYSQTCKAPCSKLSPQQKVDGLHTIVNHVKTGMLTTRDTRGCMHSRAMAPSAPYTATQVSLVFIANKATLKCGEIQNDENVNVSFYDRDSTNWASYCGKAYITQDKEKIAKHWSTVTSAWFGDLGDGIHKGDQNDPRVALIEVVPDEIRYFQATKGAVGRAIDVAASAVSGKGASPGELRTLKQG